jgi:hypothetical protein
VKIVRTAGVALFIAATIFAAGCGSSDEDSGSSSTSTAETTETTSPETSSSTAGEPRPPISDESAARYEAAGEEYNAAYDDYAASLRAAPTDSAGNVDPSAFKVAASDLRDALFAYDAELRMIDFSGYEVELNALLDATGAQIADLDAIAEATSTEELAAAVTALNTSEIATAEASTVLTNALNNG